MPAKPTTVDEIQNQKPASLIELVCSSTRGSPRKQERITPRTHPPMFIQALRGAAQRGWEQMGAGSAAGVSLQRAPVRWGPLRRARRASVAHSCRSSSVVMSGDALRAEAQPSRLEQRRTHSENWSEVHPTHRRAQVRRAAAGRLPPLSSKRRFAGPQPRAKSSGLCIAATGAAGRAHQFITTTAMGAPKRGTTARGRQRGGRRAARFARVQHVAVSGKAAGRWARRAWTKASAARLRRGNHRNRRVGPRRSRERAHAESW